MKSNAFGLDIGTTSIKVIYLNREKNQYTYGTSLTTAAPVQGMSSESPFDQQELAQQINKLVIDAKITTNNVNIALPENHVFTKVIDMPLLSEKELENAIFWEAEQYIPVPLDTVKLDWSILHKPNGAVVDAKMQVLLVAAPIQLIKKYQTILEMAGLTITSIETEILAVIRSIVADKQTITSLLMHIGALTTSLCIVQNGVIVFNYTVPVGGISFTRAIAADFGFSLEQAEEYKRVYGLSDKNFGGKVGKAIEPILTILLTEVKKAMTYYADKYKTESAVSQILLTGGGANLPGIGIYFAQNISIEAVIANPWTMLNVQNVPHEIQTRGPEYAVAIGLATKEYEQ